MTAKNASSSNSPKISAEKSTKADRHHHHSKIKNDSEKEKSSARKSESSRFTNTELDTALVDKAVRAVLKYHEKITEESTEKISLLGNDRPVHVQFTLLRAPEQSHPKPVQIVVPHPFFKLANSSDSDDDNNLEEPEICLIVKESSKPWCREMIEKFPDHMGCVKKVLGLDSLRTKHTSYEQKRDLLHKYNMFMADDRILPMLSKSLGKAFIQTKRLPVPISLTREKALPFAVQKALSATYMTVNTGTCITVRAGHTGMDPNKLVENIVAISKAAVPKMPRKWANVQLIGVKTADSISLPIYNKTPEALREIAKLAGIKENVGIPADSEVNDEGTKNNDTSKDMKNKKRHDMKSPLLRALKKQKRGEEEETKSHKKQTKNGQNTNDADKKEIAEERKPKRKSSETSQNAPESDLKDTVKEPSGSKSKSEVNVQGKKEKKMKRTEQEDDESPNKKQKKEGKRSDSKEDSGRVKEKKSRTQQDFVAAKTFKGSKEGYVFKMGKEGLGYYIDVKPVVDRAAMEAIKRLGNSSNSRRGGQKKNKYKGTRRF